MNGITSGTITLTGGDWTVNGNWDTSGVGATFTKGSSTVTLSGAAKTLRTRDASNGFHNLTISGTVAQNNATDVDGTLSIDGTLTTTGNDITGGASLLVAGGGTLTAGNSTITIRSIDTSAGAFTAGTSTLVVNASGGSIRITQPIFSLTVIPGVSTTFSSNVTWSGALALTGTTVTFNGNVTSTGSATLVFDLASIAIAGSWDSSSLTTFTSTGSSVTFTGTSRTIAMGASQSFATLTIAGTIALRSNLTAANLTVAGSSTLTKTGYGITFNRLSVVGTIADSSVSVSTLTVTNNDGSALITITAFGDWTTGASYAWTHSSTETTQTITWTIGGNTVRLPFTVTKDGSPFVSGTVDDAGQVVFTMLGSDPNMRVTVQVPVVIPPPGPGWWQTPYMFLILPGIFLGVAMFAQRQRWRPAKAFLVDERGKMLREFTLDPSCQVTYDQAVQAGVLDAVEKPIRVTKYHGQTVRGDALGVVLLAYGPVTLEHVEFAREMLVQIQDKFEDAVKQRLEEARLQETDLQAQTKGLEERRVGIETRTSELDAMTQRAEARETKIAADTESLEAKEQDLRRREDDLAEGRKAVDEQVRQVEELRTSIDRRTEEVQGQAAEVIAKSEAVRIREEGATALEATLRQRDDALGQGEARLQDAMERLATETSEVHQRLDEAGRREEALSRDQADLANGRQKFEVDQKELLEFKRSIDSRVSAVEESEAAMGQLSKELAAREARIAAEEARLAERANAVDQEEARGAFESDRREFEERRAQYDEEMRRRGDDLDSQAKTLGESQLRLAQETETFEVERTEKSQAILSREIELEAREQSLREKEDAVRGQAEENARRVAELTAQDESLEIEAAKADKLRGDLEARKVDLANGAKELEVEAARLRDEETRAAEERRTWQTTLESEQALLKGQRDAFEQEAASARASWADRVMRIEAREVDAEEKEEKVRTDVDWIARSEEDLKRREKAVEEAGLSAAQMKATAERVAKEAEQRFLEIESRERALREEAAHRSIELTQQTEGLKRIESELGSRQADFEKERVMQTERLRETETNLQMKAQTLEAKARELADRESRVAATEEASRQADLRVQQERADIQATAKQVESQQLELAQLKDRYDSEAARVRSEIEGMRQSVAAKEAELRGERERVERDSAALQETLGAKAKEMSVRERALSAREAELQAEEH